MNEKGQHFNVHEVGKKLVTLLRHNPTGEINEHNMDRAGWVKASLVVTMKFMLPRRKGDPRVDLDTLLAIVEADNQMKIRFLLCEHDSVVYIRAAQAQSEEVGRYLDWDLALNLVSPDSTKMGDPPWIDVGVHGATS
eukprot:15463585-Alexandrium_andersonii.AAC.1